MNRFLASIVVMSTVAWGGVVCTTGTLASYEALGSGGCTIGTVTLASFGAVPGTTGATEIDPTAVTVTPSGDSTDPELTFSVNLTVNAPPLLESIFTYTVSGPSFTMDTITLTGAAETVDGAVTDLQNYCFGGTFGPDGIDGCTAVNGTLLTLDGFQNTDDTAISGATLLAITDDFTIDPGTAGTASAGAFSDQFNSTAAAATTPEPGAFLLTFTGLALAGARKLRRVL